VAALFARPAARLLAAGAAVGLLLLAALPLGQRVAAGATAARFLGEFLSEGGRPWLSAVTDVPIPSALALAGGGVATLWQLPGPAPRRGLLLVHGLTPAGRDDPRLQWAATLLARGGFAVLVPELPELRAQRLRPGDAAVVADALTALAGVSTVHGQPVTIVAVSVGLQPALAGAVAVGRRVPIRRVVSVGGYAEVRELVRFFTTGAFGYGGHAGRQPLAPEVTRAFMALNLDLVRDPADRAAVAAALAGAALPPTAGTEARAVLAVLQNRDPARVDGLLAALPPETQALLDTLSPARVVRRLPGRLVLVHGRDDPAIPFTESLRLAAAADPRRTRLVLLELLAHVEGQAPAWRQAWELARFWTVAYELFLG
jgi:fermentation-respiration switch protein FrsA (DUF1100 family)